MILTPVLCAFDPIEPDRSVDEVPRLEDLVGALDKFKVGKTEKDQLLGALGPMKTDIVEKK